LRNQGFFIDQPINCIYLADTIVISIWHDVIEG